MIRKTFLEKMFRAIPILFVLVLMSGCIPLVVGAGAGYVGTKVAEERSVGTAVDDTTIAARTHSKFIQEDLNRLFRGISVEVYEGRVLLTGTVPDYETKIKAVEKAWEIDGVKEVINEINVGDKTGIKDYARDAWISTQARTKLLLNKDVKSRNYNVETVNSVVYLIGVAQSESELRLASYLAGTVKGVEKVVSHVRIKDSAIRKQGLGYRQ